MDCNVEHQQSRLLVNQQSDTLQSSPERRVTDKCCTQACYLREQHSEQELQKLRESFKTLKLDTDKEIAFLKQQLTAAYGAASTTSKTANTVATSPFRSPPVLWKKPSPVSPLEHTLVPAIYSITDTGVKLSGRIDRLGSHNSSQVLAALRPPPTPAGAGVEIVRRVVAALADPRLTTLPYLRSLQFAADLIELSAQVGSLLEREARCLALKSPVYVFGDVHGNWTDLHFFAEHMWRLGLEVTAGSFLFLGDYVDRGSASIECAAYLFAQKLLHPDKLFLLRGNHETRAVNGLETFYGSTCLLAQCKARFGGDEGTSVWHQINHAFDRLPVAAVIDNDVFCVHGGIPRPPERGENTLEAISKLSTAVPLDALEPSYYDAQPQLSMVADMIWGDPVRGEGAGQDRGGDASRLDPRGFGKSPRGGVAVSFGSRAVDQFLAQNNFSRILRAHEAAHAGLSFSNAARVVTVFSTSKDHGLGDEASCGCVLVDKQHLRFLNRSSDFGRHQQEEYRYRRRSGSGAFSLGFTDRLSMETATSGGSTVSTGRRPGRAASTDCVRVLDCVQGVRHLVGFASATGGNTNVRAAGDCDRGDTDDEGEQQHEGVIAVARERLDGVDSRRCGGVNLAFPARFVARHRRQSDSSDQQDNNQADDL